MKESDYFVLFKEKINYGLHLMKLYPVIVIMEIISECYMKQTDARRVLCFFKFIDTYLNFVSVGECWGSHGNKLKQQRARDVLGCLVLAMPAET